MLDSLHLVSADTFRNVKKAKSYTYELICMIKNQSSNKPAMSHTEIFFSLHQKH